MPQLKEANGYISAVIKTNGKRCTRINTLCIFYEFSSFLKNTLTCILFFL